jgi:hypothetical protein
MVKENWNRFLDRFLDIHRKHENEVIWVYGRLFCKKCNCYSKFIDDTLKKGDE